MKKEYDLLRVVNPFVYAHINNTEMKPPTIPPWLHESYAQCYEDVIVLQMMKGFAVRHNFSTMKVSYLEIGANHPVCTSSSYLLHADFGVTGILVEPNPLLAAELRKFRPYDVIMERAVTVTDEKTTWLYLGDENEISSTKESHVEEWTKEPAAGKVSVETIRINELMEAFQKDIHVVLSIDVEGQDWEILQDLDLVKHRPIIIQIEPSEDFYPGNTKLMVDYLRANQYVLMTANFVNLIFHDRNRL